MGLVCQRNPMASPTASSSTMVRVVPARSARVRPAGSAERAMGRERNRSMTPLARSSAILNAAPWLPNRANWASSPGMSQLTYLPWAAGGSVGWIAPPKTSVNIRMKMTGMTLEVTSTSGSRSVRIRSRRAMTAMSLKVRPSPAGGLRVSSRAIAVAGGGGVVAGQREEDLVKGRPAQRRVLWRDAGGLQAVKRHRQGPGAVRRGEDHRTVMLIDGWGL